ncbi:hypothetical protein GX408_03430 [bacterium]|nr:hypothetical protein [bacterium]
MKELDFTIKTVTPAFIAGAMEKDETIRWTNNKGKQESKKVRYRLIGMDGDGLRVPSLRGILRFWFRAKEGVQDCHLLAEKEAWLFGSTECGQGIRLIPASQESWEPLKLKNLPPGQAQAYLGYGPLNYLDKISKVTSHNKSSCRDAIPVNTSFEFKALGTKEQIEEIEKILILLHLFGGAGSRSRRGWGSLIVPSISQTSYTSITQYFKDLLIKVWPDKADRPSLRAWTTNYSAFTKDTKAVISHELKSYEEALDFLFAVMQIDRSHKNSIGKKDHDLEYGDNTKPQISGVPERIAFGLPYHPKSKKGLDIEYIGFIPDPSDPSNLKKAQKIDRRASPLLLKVLFAPDKKYYAVALFFNNSFFGNPTAQIGTTKHDNTLPFPGYTAITKFMSDPKWNPISLP